jgi:hypothetical protein
VLRIAPGKLLANVLVSTSPEALKIIGEMGGALVGRE